MSLHIPILIGLHLIAALASMTLGIMAMRNNKTPQQHKRVGIAYVVGMSGVVITGAILLIFRFNFFLMLVTVLSAQSFITGLRAARRKSRGKVTRFDWAVTAISSLVAVTFLVYGILGMLGTFAVTFPPIYFTIGIAFAGLIGSGAWEDVKFYRNRPKDRRAWLYYHIDRMLSSYLALVVAMSVTVARFTMPADLQWLAWTVPPIIGSILISRYMKNYRAQFATPVSA